MLVIKIKRINGEKKKKKIIEIKKIDFQKKKQTTETFVKTDIATDDAVQAVNSESAAGTASAHFRRLGSDVAPVLGNSKNISK